MFLFKIFALVSILVATNTESRTFVEEHPVFWGDKSEPVVDEYIKINLDVDIFPPCDLDAFPPGCYKSELEIEKLRHYCSKEYQEMFLNPLSATCQRYPRDDLPVDTRTNTVDVKLALLVGYGSIYSYSSLREGDISKMKLDLKVNGTKMTEDEILKLAETKISQENSFEKLLQLSNLSVWGKAKITDYVGMQQHQRRISNGVLKILGVEDIQTAFGDVLLYSARNFGCSLHTDRKNLKVTFSLPKVNKDLKIIHAEPFKITEKFQNYVCVLQYNGTKNVVWSTWQNCIFAKDVEIQIGLIYHEKYKYTFLNESGSCIPPNPKTTAYFTVSECFKHEARQPVDLINFKHFNGTAHVYCDGSNVTTFYTHENVPCPAYVFQLNANEFIDLHEDTTPPSYLFDFNFLPEISLKLNAMLNPAPINKMAILSSEFPPCSKPPSSLLYVAIGFFMCLVTFGLILFVQMLTNYWKPLPVKKNVQQ